jgi:hypothetical protein
VTKPRSTSIGVFVPLWRRSGDRRAIAAAGRVANFTEPHPHVEPALFADRTVVVFKNLALRTTAKFGESLGMTRAVDESLSPLLVAPARSDDRVS